MNKEILPSMLNRNSGHIVSMSSVTSMVGTHSLSAYTASMWGITGELIHVFFYLSTILKYVFMVS